MTKREKALREIGRLSHRIRMAHLDKEEADQQMKILSHERKLLCDAIDVDWRDVRADDGDSR